jgi:hypothetical protein
MEKIRFAARIYARDGAEYTGGGYPTLRQAIRGAQAHCKMIGGAEYHIHRWCPYTGYAEIVGWIGHPENPPDASCRARARRNPVGRRNHNRRGADMTKTAEATYHKPQR